ncbi:hypothetical protein QBC32DRAFT_349713 [Pseudoneurospora amorphoporcata]|uniref:AB hydrolase-1 domain-containing protein n=1 Tax=Pseudoneurospora amorphoporcata TaxID=241081 RepID=A0AAN6SDP6_9PEZI|nr:hypothetical protein QBC32DRAFT_349713 [Pseudoneurospora amorphoporcata]
MATLDGEGLGLHKPQDMMMSPWAVSVQRYNDESREDDDLPLTAFDIDYQNLSLLLREAATLYHPQCAKPKLYPTIVQPYIPVPVTTPVVPVLRSVAEYDTWAVPLRRRKHNILPLSAVSMAGGHQKSTEALLWTGIRPAVLVGIEPRLHVLGKDGFTVRTLEFAVPLDHDTCRQKEELKLHAELVDSYSTTTPADALSSSPISRQKPFILYLCGGPGDGNPSDRVPELNKFCIQRGYQVLYVHYRGTGQSPLFFDSTAEAKVLDMSDQDKANYLAKFRQDNIVRDLEAIRLCLNKHLSLTTKEQEIKWTLIGQSFGGWVATTYLSFLPSSLEAVYISAGMPPLGRTAREVYEKTYAHIVKRNEDYFNEYFPEDQEHVRTIVGHLVDKAPLQKGVAGMDGGQQPFRGYELYGDKGERSGCYLTYQTFMTLGRTFGSAPVVSSRDDDEEEEKQSLSLQAGGSSVGAPLSTITIKPSKSSLASSVPEATSTPKTPAAAYKRLHNLITHLVADLNSSSSSQQGTISPATLSLYTSLESFALHRRPLYALLHEAIYCSSTCPQTSQPSNWAATDVALSHPSGAFDWLSSSSCSLAPQSTTAGKKVYYFTGETLHPTPTLSHLGGSALGPFLGAAELLAKKSDWASLYSLASLQENNMNTREKGVRVRAVAYREDMYVDLELSKQAADKIGGCELLVCPFREWGHGSLKEVGKTGVVLGWLFDGV